MIKLLEDYLNAFREELGGSDRATVQDTLSDAEDHLTAAMETEMSEHPVGSEKSAARSVLARFGDTAEVAGHYRMVEKYTPPVLASRNRKGPSFFGVITEPSAWAAFL